VERPNLAMYVFVLLMVMTSVSAIAATHSINIKVTLAENSIQLNNNVAKAGKLTFEVSNSLRGMSHEMVVLKTELAEDKLPMKADGRVDEASLKKVGEVEDVKFGKKKTITLKLNPGRYVLICNIPNHYKNGMHATLTVE
jgi:uncharacterized cupredoxin-like copper-binding protein